MLSPTVTTAFRLTPLPFDRLPERINRTLSTPRRKRGLGELLDRLYASDAYQCLRAQGCRIAARAMRNAVIARWSLS